MEDDEFMDNLLKHKFYIERPSRAVVRTGSKDTFIDTHTGRRVRDNRACHTEHKPNAKRFNVDGANSTKYNITDIKELTINGAMVTILNVEHNCDKNLTPWCDCSDI